ncbi:hypothetical protein ACJX0J_041115, partial [Zea mays]
MNFLLFNFLLNNILLFAGWIGMNLIEIFNLVKTSTTMGDTVGALNFINFWSQGDAIMKVKINHSKQQQQQQLTALCKILFFSKYFFTTHLNIIVTALCKILFFSKYFFTTHLNIMLASGLGPVWESGFSTLDGQEGSVADLRECVADLREC